MVTQALILGWRSLYYNSFPVSGPLACESIQYLDKCSQFENERYPASNTGCAGDQHLQDKRIWLCPPSERQHTSANEERDHRSGVETVWGKPGGDGEQLDQGLHQRSHQPHTWRGPQYYYCLFTLWSQTFRRCVVSSTNLPATSSSDVFLGCLPWISPFLSTESISDLSGSHLVLQQGVDSWNTKLFSKLVPTNDIENPHTGHWEYQNTTLRIAIHDIEIIHQWHYTHLVFLKTCSSQDIEQIKYHSLSPASLPPCHWQVASIIS